MDRLQRARRPRLQTIDISGTGTEIVGADLNSTNCSAETGNVFDGGFAELDLPFAFSFYGADYGSVSVNVNGWLTFEQPTTVINCFTNEPLPSTDVPNGGIIAPLWDDYEIGGEGPPGGQIFYETLADGRFVVQFDNVQKFANDTENNTFQVILSPAGTIKYQYVDLQSTAFSYSIGIENLDGTDGLEVAMGSTYAENGLAVLISAAPGFVTAVSPATGTIPAGGSVDVDVTFDASGLIGGVYEGSLTVETDLDADPNVFELDVQLNVEGMAACMLTAAELEFDDTIVGNASSEDATVTNGGTDACALTGASASGPFSVEGFNPVTLAPGASTTFSVVFEPTAAGAASGTLTVTQDGGGDLTAGLSGLGQDEPTPAVDPASLTFNVPVGGTDSQALTLSNVGGADAADLAFDITIVEARPAPNGAREAFVSGVRTIGETRGTSASRLIPERLPQGPFEQTAEPNRGGGDIVQDGSFEDGTPNSFWTEFSAAFGTPLCDVASCGTGGGTGPFDGNWWTWFGGIASGDTGSVEQDLVIPSGTAVLSFYLEMSAAIDAPGSMDVLIDGQQIFGVTEADLGSYDTYQEVMVDVSAFADGGTHTLRFESVTSANGNFFIDLVSITATGPALVSASPISGVIAAGDDQEVTVTVDATDTEPGTYEFELVIATNDPSNPTLTVPVTINVTTTANEDDAVPTVFALEAAYPNPFARGTTIGYAVPEAAHVTIAVYDAVGRRVATLVDAEQAVGRYTAEWDASSLASGVYLYRMTAGSYTKTLKVSLVR